MIVLVALTAAIYAAALIVFAGGIALIPGITNVRPANVFPIVFGICFGPAGAWGSAIGLLIGDVFGGTLNPASLGGFVGGFYQGFIAYKIWGALRSPLKGSSPLSGRNLAVFALSTLTASVGAAVIIAWSADLLGLVPFAALSVIISLNNFLPAILLGPPLLLALYPRLLRWGLLWTDVLDVVDTNHGRADLVGVVLLLLSSFGGLAAGLLVATGQYQQEMFQFGTGATGQVGVSIVVAPFLALIVLSGWMISSRRDLLLERETTPTSLAPDAPGTGGALP